MTILILGLVVFLGIHSVRILAGPFRDAQVAANDMQAAGAKAADSAAQSATDMAITTKVNAALAADDQLSALKIDVDTEAGNVALTGTAPDEASRERATTLAAAVDGVVTVENRLTVAKNS